MYARWGCFAVGLALVLAPLVVGYGSAAPILHDVAMGSLVCIATLAAIEWPRARLAVVAPAVWLVAFGAASERAPALVDLSAGVLLLALTAASRLRRGRAVPAVPGSARARARA